MSGCSFSGILGILVLSGILNMDTVDSEKISVIIVMQ